MIRIQNEIDDDFKFTQVIEAFVNRLVENVSPKEFFLVKIDHWFDFKWRGFQGKLLGVVGLRDLEKLRVPPFVPDRVLSQLHFEKADQKYSERNAELHFYKTSSDNLTSKCLSTASEPRLFIWYSGGTKSTARGSLMAYVIEKESPRSFYISLSKNGEWMPLKTDGISKNEARFLIEPIAVQ